MTVQNIINDIKALQGAEVKIFGQPTTLENSVDKCTVDVLDILDKFRSYEKDMYIEPTFSVEENDKGLYDILDEEGDVLESDFEDEDEAEERMYELRDGSEDETTEDVEKYIDYLESMYGELKEIKHDNTYNYNCNISHHMDYKILEHPENGYYLVQLMVHRFGDVRGNYTDYCLLEFVNDYEFFEVIRECDTIEEYRGYTARISALDESFEVEDEDGNILDETAYDWESFTELVDSQFTEVISVQLTKIDGEKYFRLWKNWEITSQAKADTIDSDFQIDKEDWDFDSIRDILKEHGFMPKMNEFVQIGDETVIEEILEVLE